LEGYQGEDEDKDEAAQKIMKTEVLNLFSHIGENIEKMLIFLLTM